MKKHVLSLLCLVLFYGQLFSQNSGNQIFDNSKLHEVRLEFTQTNFWQSLTSNYESNPDGDIPYILGKVTIDGEEVDSIGVRLKGFTSYSTGSSNKKPIKLDFNEFVPGKRYDGLRKLNLNNGLGDPAVQRDFIAYKMLRDIGVKVPRTAYTRVYINDVFWGLYLLVEQVDKEFLKRNFSNPGGNLFKNKGWTKHEWKGSNPNGYSPPFELKTNETANDWSGFVNFTNVLNNSSDSDFPTAIQEVFNVDRYLKTLAVDVATNNWDSYLEHGRNWYIYEDTITGIFNWIPWDYNLSMAGSLGGGGGGGSITNPADCYSILSGSSPYPADDTLFIQVIEFDAFCCFSGWDSICQGYYDELLAGGTLTGPGSGGGGGGNGFAIDQQLNEGVIIKRLLSVPEFRDQYYTYVCDLMHYSFNDENLFPVIEHNESLIRAAVEEDQGFLYSIDEFNADMGADGLKRYLSQRAADLNEEIKSLIDCPPYNSSVDFNQIVINEFVASNDSLSGIADQDGDFDDWIELYNNTDNQIDLSGIYLSDDLTDTTKWAFPSGTIIGAKGYLIIWADKDEEQQGLHTNFKLSKSGEQLMLSNADGSVIDSLTFGEQTTNMGSARIPNGSGDFVIQAATFNRNNESSTSTLTLDKNLDLQIFPNPASTRLTLKLKQSLDTYQATIVNAIGQTLFVNPSFNGDLQIDLQQWPEGVYFIQVKGKKNVQGVHKFIIQR